MDLREVPHTPFQRHPWEMARFGFFARVLSKLGNLGSAASILDVGSGDAWFANELVERTSARITCWDIAYADSEQRAVPAPHQRISLCHEQPDQRFDAVLMLDVLEHVADDRAFLQSIVEGNLQPGGLALISVPAWQALLSSHDHALGHYRRYSPPQLTRLVHRAGLAVVRRGGLFHSLLMPRALSVARERLLGNGHGRSPGHHDALRWEHGPLITRSIMGALRLDTRLSYLASGLSLELPGLTVWALCRK